MSAVLHGKPRRHRKSSHSRTTPALLATLAVVIVAYLAFFKTLPFEQSFEIHAEFSSAAQIVPGTPVRIAGLQIGSVASVRSGPGNTAIVNIVLDQPQLLHQDATLAIKPRLLFEGNNYIEVSPGTPSAPLLEAGTTIPETRTSAAVPLQALLNVLDSPTRADLKGAVAQLSYGLGAGSPAAATGTPAGEQGLRAGVRALDSALTGLTITAEAVRGTTAGDLHNTIDNTANLTTQLSTDPQALADFVTSYNSVFQTLAGQSSNLTASLRDLLALLTNAPTDLRSINIALPRLTSFAGSLRPVLQQAPQPLLAASDALGQLDQTVQRPALPTLLEQLAAVTDALPTLERRLGALMPRLTPVAKCLSRNIVPVLDEPVPDVKQFYTGRPAWQGIVHLTAGFSGASDSFDGNGTTLRGGLTASELALSTTLPGFGQLIGTGTGNIEGVRPEPLAPGTQPPSRPDVPCTSQALPNLAADGGGVPTTFTASPAPGPSAADLKLLGEILSGPTGRKAALSQLLATLPVLSGSRPAGRTRKAGVPHPVAAQAPSASTPPLLLPPPKGGLAGIHIPGLGATGGQGSVAGAIGQVLRGLLGGLGRR